MRAIKVVQGEDHHLLRHHAREGINKARFKQSKAALLTQYFCLVIQLRLMLCYAASSISEARSNCGIWKKGCSKSTRGFGSHPVVDRENTYVHSAIRVCRQRHQIFG